MLKSFHIMLAYLTTVGFIVRGIWAITDSPERNQRWVRVAPHVIDTLLLSIGVYMAFSIGASLTDGWLVAKMIALLAYIGFGVVAMRVRGRALKWTAFALALGSVGYLFSAAFTRSPWPFGG